MGIESEVWISSGSKQSPPREQFFGWLVWLGRVKSGELLITWGIIRDHGAGLCLFCGHEMESGDHALLLCSHVWRVWSTLLKWWGLKWLCPCSVRNLLDWWQSWRFKKLKKLIWESIPLATC